MRIDFYETLMTPAQEMDYVLPSLLVGSFGAFVAPGGMGKSMFALELAIHIAGGPDLLGVGPLKQGPVVYISAEDPVLAIEDRIRNIGKHLSQEQIKTIRQNLVIESVLGRTPDLLDEKCVELLVKQSEGRRLLILDTLRRFSTEDENSSSAMSQVLNRIELIARDTNAAVIFTHHTSKDLDAQYTGRGSSVIAYHSRWQSVLREMTKSEANEFGIDETKRTSYLRYSINKANFGSCYNGSWLIRRENGLLEKVTLQKQQKSQKPSNGRVRGEA
ncbi:helicase RepA family protein [Marinomonas fungiae]|uniref:Plasmid and phage replicative helicase n=1 Tax=Marinomonas fungiae TaxID=1137284 RepID=A0A0K6ITP4_9GAMM|nr:helicase RepA family protein [Marinomonas fungiae]CUB06475.1 plasmid and phage replicative helicase [Marinomonas fungiae]